MAKLNIIGTRKTWLTISLILVAGSLILLFTQGLNFGLDFTGGTLLERGFKKPVTAGEIRSVLEGSELKALKLDKSVIQPVGNGSEALIRTKKLSDQQIRKVDEALEKEFGKVSERRTDMVEPVIGKELMRQAGLALLVSWLLIMVYIGFRFEFQFGVAAVGALVHDVIITLGIFSLIGREINMPYVAAILTIVGYSINDTIVVFDRIRENLQRRRREDLEVLVNSSIVETLPRTINTSITTLFSIVAILIFGGATLKDFSLALFIGVIVGTYSSVYIASPLWLGLKKLEEKKRASTSARA